jgi:alkylation response protein AidB-like acyl-CoA dehydrogenase
VSTPTVEANEFKIDVPEALLTATETDGSAEFNGTKSWCSRAGLCMHALVAARCSDGAHGLCAVDLRCSRVTPLGRLGAAPA